MKGKLFKRIGAIATTAAMLASLGVTGFAAGENDVTPKAPVVTKQNNGIYQVVIPYETTAAHDIGVTMLAYGHSDHKSATSVDQTGTDKYTDAMEIVGVDQINKAQMPAADGTTGKVTGDFTFYVDTTPTDADADGSADDWTEDNPTGVIRMAKGQKGVVLLSGDKADGAKGVLFQAGNPDAVVKQISVGSTNTDIPPAGIAVNAAARPTAASDGEEPDGAVTAADVEAASKAAIAAGVVICYDDGGIEKTQTVTADNLTLANPTPAYSAVNRKPQEITYEVTVSSDAYDLTGDTTFTAKVTYPRDPFTAVATGATMPDLTVSDTTITAKAALTTAVETLVEAGNMVVTLSDVSAGTEEYTTKAADFATAGTEGTEPTLATGGFAVAADTGVPETVTTGTRYNYVMTIPANAKGLYDEGIDNTAAISVAFGVTIETPWVVDGVVVKNGETVVTGGAFTKDLQLTGEATYATRTQLVAAVNEVLTDAVTMTVKGEKGGVDKEVEATKNTTDSQWTITPAPGTADQYVENTTYTVKVPYIVPSEATDSSNLAFVTVAVTIKPVAPAEERLLGDVMNKGVVKNTSNWMNLKAYIAGYMDEETAIETGFSKKVAESDNEDMVVVSTDNITRLAADVTGDGQLKTADWMNLKAYISGYMDENEPLYTTLNSGTKVTK